MKTKSLIFCFIAILCLLKQSKCYHYDENLASQLTKLSIASYCVPENIRLWDCGQACEMSPELIDINYIANEVNFGYIGYNKQKNSINIIFRGTVLLNLNNWFNNLKIIYVSKYKLPKTGNEQYSKGFEFFYVYPPHSNVSIAYYSKPVPMYLRYYVEINVDYGKYKNYGKYFEVEFLKISNNDQCAANSFGPKKIKPSFIMPKSNLEQIYDYVNTDE